MAAPERSSLRAGFEVRDVRLGYPALADELSNLGNLLAEQHDLAAARPLLERALALRERQLGPHDPDVATDLGNLGLVVEAHGELVAARRLH